jgi:hypothetical protein
MKYTGGHTQVLYRCYSISWEGLEYPQVPYAGCSGTNPVLIQRGSCTRFSREWWSRYSSRHPPPRAPHHPDPASLPPQEPLLSRLPPSLLPCWRFPPIRNHMVPSLSVLSLVGTKSWAVSGCVAHQHVGERCPVEESAHFRSKARCHLHTRQAGRVWLLVHFMWWVLEKTEWVPHWPDTGFPKRGDWEDHSQSVTARVGGRSDSVEAETWGPLGGQMWRHMCTLSLLVLREPLIVFQLFPVH